MSRYSPTRRQHEVTTRSSQFLVVFVNKLVPEVYNPHMKNIKVDGSPLLPGCRVCIQDLIIPCHANVEDAWGTLVVIEDDHIWVSLDSPDGNSMYDEESWFKNGWCHRGVQVPLELIEETCQFSYAHP